MGTGKGGVVNLRERMRREERKLRMKTKGDETEEKETAKSLRRTNGVKREKAGGL